MIDTLLGLSRTTSRELKRERVDLSQIARELAEDLRTQDAARAVDFVVAPSLRADGDATLLRLVLQNLLGNALEVHRPHAAGRRRRVSARHGWRHRHLLRRSDNGAGFDMRFAEKMFGLFQRLHERERVSRAPASAWPPCRSIVRRHGGRVWAEAIPAPNEGHGATFYFTLWENQPA
ncbi:MAG: ATP-binding protein [Ignavibacteriales bacterium]|nr:ATP-binding protein [Ignavibacteriales bacterium]